MTPSQCITGQAIQITASAHVWEGHIEHRWLRNEPLPNLPGDAPDPIDVVQALLDLEIDAMALISVRAGGEDCFAWIAHCRGDWYDLKQRKVDVALLGPPQSALFETAADRTQRAL